MEVSETTRPLKGARLALGIGGLISIGFGVAVLAWPTKAAVVLTGIIAVYAVVTGIVYAALAVSSKRLGAGGRIGHLLLGILYIIAGLSAFSSLDRSAVFLAVFLTIMVGVMWIVEGITALFLLGKSNTKVFTIIFAVFSVFAGFVLISSPLWGVVSLWLMLGGSLIVLGGLNIVRSITMKKG